MQSRSSARSAAAASAISAAAATSAATDDGSRGYYGEQLTRYSRALKVWLSVSYFGTTALAAAIDGGMDLAARAEQRVRDDADLEVLSPARFGICCFRVRPRGGTTTDLDALNERVLARVNAGGRYFISSTRLRGAYSLRICILGYRTTAADVDGLIDDVSRYGKEES